MISGFWKKFKAGLFTRTQFLTGAMIFFLTCSAVLYAFEAIIGLNTFSPGQSISAAQVNDNFAKINQAMINLKYHKKFAVGVSIDTSYIDSFMDLDIPFDTLLYDSSGHTYGNMLLNSNEFTIQENGVYEFSVITFDTNVNNNITYNIKTSFGSDVATLYFNSNLVNTPSYASKSIYLNSNTTISIKGYVYNDYNLIGSKFKLMMQKID